MSAHVSTSSCSCNSREPSTSAKRTVICLRSAGSKVPGACPTDAARSGPVGVVVRAAPQPAQYRSTESTGRSQTGHFVTIAAPQPAQNVPPARSSWPQVEQTALIYRKAYLGSEQGPEGALAYFVAHCALRR